jgi:hypothetical protein
LKKFSCSIKLDPIDEEQAGAGYTRYLIVKKYAYKLSRKMRIKERSFIRMMNSISITHSREIYKFFQELKITEKTNYVEGAFQSWKYFDGIKDILKKEFTPRIDLQGKNKEYLDMMRNVNSVCVHVRLGDYTNDTYNYGLNICDKDYFKEGIEIIKTKVENPVFFVFSNSHKDIQNIKEHFEFDESVQYIDVQNTDIEDFALMMKCKHFIISNSTYSWWAQYLSQNDEKIVVAPKIWNRVATEFQDIYMDNWITI